MMHEWIFWHNLTVCRKCGIVRRADDLNKPCKGVVGMRAFEKPLVQSTEISDKL